MSTVFIVHSLSTILPLIQILVPLIHSSCFFLHFFTNLLQLIFSIHSFSYSLIIHLIFFVNLSLFLSIFDHMCSVCLHFMSLFISHPPCFYHPPYLLSVHSVSSHIYWFIFSPSRKHISACLLHVHSSIHSCFTHSFDSLLYLFSDPFLLSFIPPIHFGHVYPSLRLSFHFPIYWKINHSPIHFNIHSLWILRFLPCCSPSSWFLLHLLMSVFHHTFSSFFFLIQVLIHP